MSMNEFEREEKTNGEESSSLAIHSSHYPSDFNEDDLTFAQELNALFSPEAEELPPYYVQTLLDADDQRFDPVERGFEYKTSAHVFRRLKLRRRLFYTHASPFSVLSMDINNAPTRRSLLALVATFLAVFLLTVAFTAPAFASGVALLLRGNPTGGVMQVNNYPTGVKSPQYNDMQDPYTGKISLSTARQQLHFPFYWPQNKLDGYTLSSINLYVGLDQQWVDGPRLEFEYQLTAPGTAKGTGKIWVDEFKPKATVLQLVENGSPVVIPIDNHGDEAIYVNGQWVRHGQNAPVWVSGGRSELIYQINGVLFWIVGDQRDNIGPQQLVYIAQGLAPLPLTMIRQFLMMGGNDIQVNQLTSDTSDPFANDAVLIDSANGIDGPYFVSGNAAYLVPTAHIQ